MKKIGILHPGAMGVSVAAAAQRGDATVCWASAGRSQATKARADEHGLTDLKTLAALGAQCDMLISVCPPAAAEALAADVLATGFRGLYVDANAISPQRAQRIGEAMAAQNVSFVDGGIVGGPAWRPGTTWLYLSGPEAAQVAASFAAGPLETKVMTSANGLAAIGKASALKMLYAAYTKGTTALLCAILAGAEALDVGAELAAQWAEDDAEFSEQAAARARRVTAKAWRFEGEMAEIAATFAAVGLPDGFHAAAGDIYHRLADFKDAPELPAMDALLAALLNENHGDPAK